MHNELETAVIAAKKAGNLILSLLGNVKISEKNSNYNLVTDADIAAQQCIIDIIQDAFKDDAIFGEEDNDRQPLTAKRLWIIDPIDGTTNFAHDIPHFSLSIAFAEAGEVQCGVVFNPVNGELFSAERTKGAWCNDKPITVSSVSTLAKSVIGTGFYYERGPLMLKTLDSIKNLLTANIQGIRRMGSAALDLCYVACGRYDGYFEYRLSPWDFAAGMLIVHEAGGICIDTDGAERGLFANGMICSNGAIHKEFCDIVVWDRKWETIPDF
jgi:myo-inositol-1(or 4)-monophosphatase